MIQVARFLIIFSVFTLVQTARAQDFSWPQKIHNYVQTYSSQSNFERMGQAFSLCEGVLAQWSTDPSSYESAILTMGDLYQSHPEAAYSLLSTCNNYWKSQFLRALQIDQTRPLIVQNKLINLAAGEGFLEDYKYLPQLIRLSISLNQSSKDIPRGPFEILAGMASSERALDETLNKEVHEAIVQMSQITAPLIGLGTLKALSVAFDSTAATSLSVGRFAKVTLALAAVSYGAGKATDYLIFRREEKALWKPIVQLREQLESQNSLVPKEMLLEEFRTAVDNLAYFYSYQLYLHDSGEDAAAEGSDNCYRQLDVYFKNSGSVLMSNFSQNLTCRDAGSVWLGASQYLKNLAPDDTHFSSVALELGEKARRAFGVYKNTRAMVREFVGLESNSWSCPGSVEVKFRSKSVEVSSFQTFSRIDEGWLETSSGIFGSTREVSERTKEGGLIKYVESSSQFANPSTQIFRMNLSRDEKSLYLSTFNTGIRERDCRYTAVLRP